MSKNRKAAEDFIIKYIAKLLPGTSNSITYKDYFASLNDKQFDQFMQDLESGDKYLTVVVPNFSKNGISVENNLKLAEELGHDFFQKLWIEAHGDTPTHLTPIEFLVIDLPIKRASQLLTKKISVPDHNKSIDAVTGQVTGESKGAKISYPELQICAAMGMDNSMVELMKYRGGDIKGAAAMNAMLSKHGTANLNTLSQYASGVESTKSLKVYLSSMHLKSTL